MEEVGNDEESVKIENNESKIIEKKSFEPAKLYFQILPWANIVVDSNKIQNTDEGINLEPGLHKIEISNPGYPTYLTDMKLNSGDIKYFKVHLDTLFGYLECKIFPWGEVFIDGKHTGQTPFLKPIMLNPGKHSISIHNPEYDTINKSFFIVKQETLKYEINLAGQQKLNYRINYGTKIAILINKNNVVFYDKIYLYNFLLHFPDN